MTTRQAFIRPAQQFFSFALSALFTVVIFTSVNDLAAQPAQDAQLARMAAPAASHAHT
jgi:hypothetical protein